MQAKKIIGPFHKAFTSIVGPNGSGKSNVIDSMLFVFGYRAQKIRSKKVSVLIHNSEKHQNLRSATVSVHFWMITDKEGDDYDVVPDSEFVVSRTAFKDNSSQYHIDGRKTNFKEVGKLLREKGIDLDHNRFLILQGEVEQISQMKPKAETPNEEGMLEYLEDIIGSSRLKPLIDKLNHQVEQLNEHRNERNNRVKLAEDDRNKLAGGFEEAKKWLILKNTQTKNKNEVYQATIFYKGKTIKTAEEKTAGLETELGAIQEKLAAHADANKEIIKAAQKAKKKKTKIDATLQTLKDKSGELESKNKILCEEKKMKKDRRKKLEKELKTAEEKVVEFSEMPQKCIDEEEQLNHKLEKLVQDEKNQHQNLEETISFVEKETSDLRKKKEPLEKKHVALEVQVNEKQQIVDEQKSVLENFTAKFDRAASELNIIKTDITNSKSKVDAVILEKDELETSIPETEAEIVTKETEFEKLQGDRVKIQENVAKAQSKLSEMKQTGGDLKSQNETFNYIMNHLKKKKIVDGIIGRLGDLGGIPKKFDVALSSSCNMNVIVVEKTTQAKQIVEYLKKDRAGQAKFFAMDKMAPFREADNRNPGPRLVDQITCDDPALFKAFYKACGETLYAENISNARQMASANGQRYRVVGLDGSIIERAGTLTGGGNRVSRGAMGEKPQIKVNEKTVTEDEVTEMIEIVDKLREELRDIDQKIRKLQGEIAQLKKKLQKNKERFEIIDTEWKTAENKIVLLEKRVKPAELEVEKNKPDLKKKKSLEELVKDAEVDCGALKAQSETIKTEVDEINKKIGDIGKGKIEGIKKIIQKTKNGIKDTKKKVLKVQNDAKTAERNRKKAEENVTSVKEESKEIEERMESIKTELEAALLEYEELEAEQAQIKEISIESAQQEIETTKQLEKSEKESEELRNGIIVSKGKINQLREEISVCNRDIKDFRNRLKSLKLEPIEETDDLELKNLEDETQCQEVDISALTQSNQKIQTELDHNKPNLGAIAEYRSRQAVYLERMKEYAVLHDARNRKREVRNELLKRRHGEFMEGFEIITNKVKQMYQMITLGGDAELELVNSLAPFDDGVIFTVRPPKKSWKNIMNLSGGEKTLSSLALVFALHHYKPTPLYVMDEIDAALDIKNVSIVAHYIKDRTKNAQFIIISLRNQMFGLASRLCGIYKTDNCTKMVVIENNREENIAYTAGDQQPHSQVQVRSPMKMPLERAVN